MRLEPPITTQYFIQERESYCVYVLEEYYHDLINLGMLYFKYVLVKGSEMKSSNFVQNKY